MNRVYHLFGRCVTKYAFAMINFDNVIIIPKSEAVRIKICLKARFVIEGK